METILLIITKLSNAFAGMFGGLAVYLIDKNLTVKDLIALVIIGGMCSFYLIPALDYYFHLDPRMASFIAFTVGIVSKGFILKAKDKLTDALVDRAEDIIRK